MCTRVSVYRCRIFNATGAETAIRESYLSRVSWQPKGAISRTSLWSMKERDDQGRRFSMDLEKPKQCITPSESRRISKTATAGRHPDPERTKRAVDQISQCRWIGTDSGKNLIKCWLFQSKINHRLLPLTQVKTNGLMPLEQMRLIFSLQPLSRSIKITVWHNDMYRLCFQENHIKCYIEIFWKSTGTEMF